MSLDATTATLLSAALAATVAISVPALTFRFTRKIENDKRVFDKRAETYLDLFELLQQLHGFNARILLEYTDLELPAIRATPLLNRIQAFASTEVLEGFDRLWEIILRAELHIDKLKMLSKKEDQKELAGQVAKGMELFDPLEKEITNLQRLMRAELQADRPKVRKLRRRSGGEPKRYLSN